MGLEGYKEDSKVTYDISFLIFKTKNPLLPAIPFLEIYPKKITIQKYKIYVSGSSLP